MQISIFVRLVKGMEFTLINVYYESKIFDVFLYTHFICILYIFYAVLNFP